MSDFGKVCPHGSVARSCEVCERDKEIAELRASVERLERELATAKEDADLQHAQAKDGYRQFQEAQRRAERAEAAINDAIADAQDKCRLRLRAERERRERAEEVIGSAIHEIQEAHEDRISARQEADDPKGEPEEFDRFEAGHVDATLKILLAALTPRAQPAREASHAE